MAVYTYECCRCMTRQDAVYPMGEQPKRLRCQACGGKAPRFFLVPQISIFKPFTTDDFGGQPVAVETKRQHEDLCKRFHVEPISPGEIMRKGLRKRKFDPTPVDDFGKPLPKIAEQYQQVKQEVGV